MYFYNIYHTDLRKLSISVRFMKWMLLVIFFLLASLSAFSNQSSDSSSALAVKKSATQLTDSILFHNFDGSNYRASSFNNMAVTDEDGIVYFGNENGLLEFDGTHWQLYKTPNFTPVTYLKIIEDKIYTFGNEDLGYFQRSSSGNLIYHSLNDKRPDDKEIPFVWNILQKNGSTYFSLDSSLLKWDGEILSRINLGASITSYKVKDDILISIYGKDQGGLALLEDDTIAYVNQEFRFEDDYVWEVLEQEEDNWLFFTSENGVYKYNAETYETTPFESEISNFYKADSTFLYWADKISDSLYITSSWENGMQLFDSGGRILKKLTTRNGLFSNFISHPEIDRRHNLWVTSGLGIQYLEFYKPKEELDFQPLAKIRYIRVGDSTLYVRDSSHRMEFNLADFKSVDFYFSAPGFFEKDLQFSYYLEGFDEEWSEWTTNSRKEYTNLPGGEYTIHLKAKHSTLDHLQFAPFHFDLIIPKPWYRYTISYVVFILIIGLLIVGFIRFRTHRLSVLNKKLEETVKERTAELRSQKERLKEANEELKTINNELDNFVYRSSHDLVAPLKSLRGLISVAGMSNNPDQIKDYFQLMNISINKLEEFIRSIMDFSTNTKKPLEIREIRMDVVIDSIVEDLKFYENAEKVELIRAYDSEFKIKTDAKRLNIVLSNLVTNALKYHDFKKDEPPYIKVSAKVENNSYLIEVEDNGSGIPEEYQGKIFNMFFRAHQGIEGSGLGLYIVRDTLNVLKGTVDFTSKVRKGTTFKVVLPVIT
ncbi:sensor histidine kinase [Marivirga harenae]|uniref:sensor histidine kinase n=1 Tax=Marivirga harenae TaxID=2010992 RepID=UPI0026DEAA11|nr:ATP-binding protein [Marivirga harenae]WKV13515.1 ATP-binding protein [Marivirga harenae]